MYVPYGDRCREVSSATPLTPAQIRAQDQRVAGVARQFDRGDGILSELILNLGGNPAGTQSGDAGASALVRRAAGAGQSEPAGAGVAVCVIPDVIPLAVASSAAPPLPPPGVGAATASSGIGAFGFVGLAVGALFLASAFRRAR